MITLQMNKDEIIKHFKNDDDEFKKAMAGSKRFWKNLHKMPKASMSNAIPYRSSKSNQKYLACYGSKMGNHFFLSLAKVLDDNHIWYISSDTGNNAHIIAYSSHFFSRYAERTGRKWEYPKIMPTYFANSPLSIRIYEDGEATGKSVYAVNEGLALCRFDCARGITFAFTFVSKDMLKDSQRRAFETVYGWLEKSSSDLSKAKSKLAWDCTHSNMISSSEGIIKAAEEIYGEYFEDIKTLKE